MASGLNIDGELAEAERFGQSAEMQTLQSIEQMFQEMQKKHIFHVKLVASSNSHNLNIYI